LRNPKFETLDGLRPLAEIEKTEKYTFSDNSEKQGSMLRVY
jgi:hypothetical protein